MFTGANLNITEARKKADKIKFVGDMTTNPFPKLQGKCASAKASLTKALTALEKSFRITPQRKYHTSKTIGIYHRLHGEKSLQQVQ